MCVNPSVVGEDAKSAAIVVANFQKAVFSHIKDSCGFWVRFTVDLETVYVVSDNTSPQVAFSHHTFVVDGGPDSASVVRLRDGAVTQVNDLIAVFEVPDERASPRDSPHRLFDFCALILNVDLLLLIRLVLDNCLLDSTTG